LGKLTNRNLPLSVLVVSIITWVIGLLEGVYCTMFGSGVVISWIYLRFYQRHSNGTKGDPAENFCFASFFPNVLQPAISVLANSLFEFFIKIGLCRKPIKRFVDSTSGPSSIQISLPGSDNSDAERRRQKALKLLSERLVNSSTKDSESRRPLLQAENSGNGGSSATPTTVKFAASGSGPSVVGISSSSGNNNPSTSGASPRVVADANVSISIPGEASSSQSTI